jgi:uncharacterized membrane protein YhaH (DUF805 family)
VTIVGYAHFVFAAGGFCFAIAFASVPGVKDPVTKLIQISFFLVRPLLWFVIGLGILARREVARIGSMALVMIAMAAPFWIPRNEFLHVIMTWSFGLFVIFVLMGRKNEFGSPRANATPTGDRSSRPGGN